MYEYEPRGQIFIIYTRVNFFIDLAEDRDQWRPVVNTIMNLWVP
jgi:hypothetical protein